MPTEATAYETSPRGDARAHGLALATTLLVCGGYYLQQLPLDWIPYDAGLLGQTAERALGGELPHADFNEPYTGGLTFWHALVFELLGVRLVSLRWALWLLSLGFLAAVYRIAARVAAPPVCAGVTLLCAAWGPPNYFAAMPSWYNLFLATFAALALFRDFERPHVGWRVLAGLLLGLSVLIKLTAGMYSLAAVLLAIWFAEQQHPSSPGDEPQARPVRLLLVGGALCLVGLVVLVLSPRMSVKVALHFLVPVTALCALVVRGELDVVLPDGVARLRRLAGQLGPLLLGFVSPVALFVSVYALRSRLASLHHGVWEVPQRFYGLYGADLPSLDTLWAALPWALAFVAGSFRRPLPGQRWLVLPVAAVALALVVVGERQAVYAPFWASLRPLVPVLVGLAAWELSSPGALPAGASRPQLMLLASLAGMFSLVQFPYSGGIYFCYVAPLIWLLGLFVVAHQPHPPRALHGVLSLFYAAFALVWLNHGSTLMLGFSHHAIPAWAPLDQARAGIRVSAPDARRYGAVVTAIHAHSAPGEPIYAAPDVPELYFLADRPNPTRTFYELVDDDYDRPTQRARRIFDTLSRRSVPVVVLGPRVEFSSAPDDALRAGLRQRYPRAQDVGGFTVRFRDR